MEKLGDTLANHLEGIAAYCDHRVRFGDTRQRAAVDAVCTDMHRPYVNAVAHQLPKAEIVFDKFHVLQHASAALDDVRRRSSFAPEP